MPGAIGGHTRCRLKSLCPRLADNDRGNLANWLKKEGEAVNAGDVIAEIETDKATMEVEAVDEGMLGKILVRKEHRAWG